MPDQRMWTVDDHIELPDDVRYELVNGSLRYLEYTAIHQHLVVEVWQAVRERCPVDWLASAQLSLAVDRHTELRPDVLAVRSEHANRSPVPVEDAILAIEIVAERSEVDDIAVKSRIYADAGVTYWVVDLLGEAISLAGAAPEPTTTTALIVSEPWPITIDLAALTAWRASILERVRS